MGNMAGGGYVLPGMQISQTDLGQGGTTLLNSNAVNLSGIKNDQSIGAGSTQ